MGAVYVDEQIDLREMLDEIIEDTLRGG